MQQSEQEFVYYETRRLTAIVAWHVGQSTMMEGVVNFERERQNDALTGNINCLGFKKIVSGLSVNRVQGMCQSGISASPRWNIPKLRESVLGE